MEKSLEEFLAENPVDETKVAAYKQQMRNQLAAQRLKDLRAEANLTQQELADRIGVGQRQVSKIEQGELDDMHVGTIRKYLASLGYELSMEATSSAQRSRVV